MSFIVHDDDKTMTKGAPMLPFGLGSTLQDAAALAQHWGAKCRIGIGTAADSDILAPAGAILQPDEIRAAMKPGTAKYIFTFGNGLSNLLAATLAPAMETLIAESGTGFMAVCLAKPALSRTVFQGHLFEGSHLRENLVQTFSNEISGRVGLVAHEITCVGASAISARLAALKDQGFALAIVDAVNEADCAAISEACASITLTGGPAWISHASPSPEPIAEAGQVAILSGALDRQTLFQIGAAAAAMPVLQLNFTRPGDEIVIGALDWAAKQSGTFLIAASAPPSLLHPGAPAADLLGAIADGLTAIGIRRFMLTGNDTAAAILNRLGETRLTTGAASGPLRWLHGMHENAFLMKPGGVGGKDLFLSQIEPHNCLNAAAE